ncbi:MAG: hypothetical protein U0791_06185 [Gemmataceae bacterium]
MVRSHRAANWHGQRSVPPVVTDMTAARIAAHSRINELQSKREMSLLQVSIGISQTTRTEKTMQNSPVVVFDAKIVQ